MPRRPQDAKPPAEPSSSREPSPEERLMRAALYLVRHGGGPVRIEWQGRTLALDAPGRTDGLPRPERDYTSAERLVLDRVQQAGRVGPDALAASLATCMTAGQVRAESPAARLRQRPSRRPRPAARPCRATWSRWPAGTGRRGDCR